jgi:hypothetical protein
MPQVLSPLTPTELEHLSFESMVWLHAGVKEQAIRESLSVSLTRHHQVVNRLIDTEAALAHSPALVNRLRRIRDVRQRSRSVRR